MKTEAKRVYALSNVFLPPVILSASDTFDFFFYYLRHVFYVYHSSLVSIWDLDTYSLHCILPYICCCCLSYSHFSASVYPFVLLNRLSS
jgi:hypothetical protein